MLYLNKLLFGRCLIQSNRFGYYIHLKDHNKKINPQKNKLTLSFMNPKNSYQNAPTSNNYSCNLRKKTQKQLERKMFEQYKQKVLKGQIDQDQQIIVDPLWGQGQKPKHYYQNISKVQLMTVSYPQISQFSQQLNSIFQTYFSSNLNQTPAIEQLNTMNPSQLLNVGLLARRNHNLDSEFWHNLQKSFGNRFYNLSLDELIKLNFAFKQNVKKGSPRIHNILNDLLQQDLNKMSSDQLISLFYSLRNSKLEAASLQDKILTNLQPFYQKMSFQQKVNWLLIYTICRRPQSFKQSEKKILNQSVIKGHHILYHINFSTELSKQLSSVGQCVNIIYSLAKLRSRNTRFIVDQVVKYLKQNIQTVKSDLEASYKLLFYLQQVEGGQGIYDEVLFQQIINSLTQPNNFNSLNKVQQVKTIYAIWNYGLLNDQIFQLYTNIQMEPDSTLLNYFCQIQYSRSSQRQWQVLRCLAELQYIPLPYFQVYKRFYNYIKATVPDWDLTPIQQKLNNTEYYFNALRIQDSFYNINVYKDLQKHFKFTQQISPFEHTIPIENLQLTQFGNATYQVTVDVVGEAAFIPTKNTLKESYRNKIRSLQYLGWKHVVLRQKQLSKLQPHQQIKQIIYACVPYIEDQQAVIANIDYYRAQQIEALRTQQYWNSMIAQEAEGYRNNPEEYAKKIKQLQQKQKKLSEQIAKVQ